MIHIVQLFLLANSDDYYTGILLVGRESVSSSYVTRVTKSAHWEQFLSTINRGLTAPCFPRKFFFENVGFPAFVRLVLPVRASPTCSRNSSSRESPVDRESPARFIDPHFVADHPIGSFSHTVYSGTDSRESVVLDCYREAASETRRTRVYGAIKPRHLFIPLRCSLVRRDESPGIPFLSSGERGRSAKTISRGRTSLRGSRRERSSELRQGERASPRFSS